MPLTTTVFDLSDDLARKADPALIERDEAHFAAIVQALELATADLSDRVDAARKQAGGTGQEAMDRDLEVHRLSSRLRLLRRFGLDLCLGRMVRADDPEPVYVGRLGLTDREGRRLLLDWRSPAAGSATTGTRCSPRTGWRGTPRWTTSPRSSPAWGAAGRPGCATCSARSPPTRTRSYGPGRGAP